MLPPAQPNFSFNSNTITLTMWMMNWLSYHSTTHKFTVNSSSLMIFIFDLILKYVTWLLCESCSRTSKTASMTFDSEDYNFAIVFFIANLLVVCGAKNSKVNCLNNLVNCLKFFIYFISTFSFIISKIMISHIHLWIKRECGSACMKKDECLN